MKGKKEKKGSKQGKNNLPAASEKPVDQVHPEQAKSDSETTVTNESKAVE